TQRLLVQGALFRSSFRLPRSHVKLPGPVQVAQLFFSFHDGSVAPVRPSSLTVCANVRVSLYSGRALNDGAPLATAPTPPAAEVLPAGTSAPFTTRCAPSTVGAAGRDVGLETTSSYTSRTRRLGGLTRCRLG